MKKLLLVIIVAVLFGCNKKQTEPADEGCNATYTDDISNIVNSKCAIPDCHNGSSGLPDFTSYPNLKSRADNGRLKEFVVEKQIMPPANATPLTESEKELFKCWLDNNAPE